MNPPEPESPEGLGPPPAHLSQEAVAAWDAFAALAPARVLTQADRIAAELIAQTYIELRECRRIVRDEGMIVIEDRGGGDNAYTIKKAHPILAPMLGLQRQLADLLGKFGMTASGRANLSIADAMKVDPLLEFMQGDGKSKDG